MKSSKATAIIVGSGPNGLSAAITLARADVRATVFEANSTIGGGVRSAELTIPGFVHDICSAVHPMACGSPFFQKLPLAQFGLSWIHPEAPLAHPLDDGSAVMLERSIETTCRGLANYIGGDINGGILDIRQFITRPTRGLNPYSTPVKGLYLCSSSTPPGGGVHGMCGYNAAQRALRAEF